MLSITEFSRLSGLPVKTLRHYHAKGVLVPHHVDEHTQYRWYSVEQVAVATQAKAMRRAGMSLFEVRGLMEDVDLVPDALRRHRERLENERSDQDVAVAELDETAGERLTPRIRQRAARVALTALGPWRHSEVENQTQTQWEQEADALRQVLADIAAEHGIAVADSWWSALEVDGEAAAQRVGLPLNTDSGVGDLPAPQEEDLPDYVHVAWDEPAEEVVISLSPEAAGAAARQAMIAALSFTADGRTSDPRTLRYIDRGGRGSEFAAVLIDDPHHHATHDTSEATP